MTFGEMTFPSPGGNFTLSARADRIDQMPDGRLAIIDYKTGNVPTKKQIKSTISFNLYHINLRKSEKNIKEIVITKFSF